MKLRLPNSIVRRSSLVRTRLPGFDPIYYLYWYPDVRAAGLDPLHHYLHHGWKEGRDPSAGFSTNGYLAANPDVAHTDQNPLIHFVNIGLAEGREGFAKDPAAPAPRPRLGSEPVKLLSGPNSAAPISLQGYVDEVSHSSVRGWAMPPGSTNSPAEIQIIVNDVFVGRVVACDFREDLQNEKIGNARHGFKYKFNPSLDIRSPQTVMICREADGFVIGRIFLQHDGLLINGKIST